MIIDTNELLAKIETFMHANKMAATAFGLNVVNDRNLVFDLRAGREVYPRTAKKIIQYIEAEQAVNGDHSSAA